MTATLATAAVLLVPFLGVVLLGALAVAIHDAIARAWTEHQTTQRVGQSVAAARRPGAPHASGLRAARALRTHAGAAPRRPSRRGPTVLVR